MQPLSIATWDDVPDREPVGALVSNVDLVIVRWTTTTPFSTDGACTAAP